MYSIDTDEWSEGAATTTARVASACCEIKDDAGNIIKVLVAGGHVGTASPFLKSTEIYDVAQKTWTNGPDLDTEMTNSRLITAPPISSYAAYILTGVHGTDDQKDIHGISKDLTEWTKLGSIQRERAATTLVMISPDLVDGWNCEGKVSYIVMAFYRIKISYIIKYLGILQSFKLILFRR